MKRILILIFIVLVLTSCNTNKKNPRKVVEKYFNSYQQLDKYALNNINFLVNNEYTLNDKQREKYKRILKNHYKNLKYKIKKEKIYTNKALIFIEIEVNNNIKVLKKSEYVKESFIDNKGNFLIEEFNNYKIDKLRSEKSKIKYEMLLSLHIEKNNWVIDEITQTNQEKMLGIYDSYM